MPKQPRLLYLIRSNNTGGTYVAFTHVQALNRLGFAAQVVYLGKDEIDFQPDLPVIKGLNAADLDPRDVLVIDEGFRDGFAKLAGLRARKVLFNQAVFYGWYFGFETPEELNAYPLDAVITASDYATGLLRLFGVAKPIHTVPPMLDERFRPGPKDLVISYNPAKRALEGHYIKTYFRARHPRWKDVPWLRLADLSRQQCADAMSRSFLYASFAHLESLGLMSLEAMKSRCLVVGFDGGGGREYRTDDNGCWIAEGDYAGFADALDRRCEGYAEADQYATTLAAGEATAARFNEARFTAALTECWNAILGAEAVEYRPSVLSRR